MPDNRTVEVGKSEYPKQRRAVQSTTTTRNCRCCGVETIERPELKGWERRRMRGCSEQSLRVSPISNAGGGCLKFSRRSLPECRALNWRTILSSPMWLGVHMGRVQVSPRPALCWEKILDPQTGPRNHTLVVHRRHTQKTITQVHGSRLRGGVHTQGKRRHQAWVPGWDVHQQQ